MTELFLDAVQMPSVTTLQCNGGLCVITEWAETDCAVHGRVREGAGEAKVAATDICCHCRHWEERVSPMIHQWLVAAVELKQAERSLEVAGRPFLAFFC